MTVDTFLEKIEAVVKEFRRDKSSEDNKFDVCICGHTRRAHHPIPTSGVAASTYKICDMQCPCGGFRIRE